MTAPEFLQKLQPCQVLDGESARFECTFSSPPDQRPSVSWYRENELIRPSTITSNFYSISTSEGKSSLTVKRATISTSGLFTVKIENATGAATSSANLHVIDGRRSCTPDGYINNQLAGTSQHHQQLLALPVSQSTCSGHQLTSFTTSSRSSSALGGFGSDLESCSSAPTTTHDLSVKVGDLTRVDARTVAIGGAGPIQQRDHNNGSTLRTHSAMSAGGEERLAHNIQIEGSDYTLLILDLSGCQHGQYCTSPYQCQQAQHQPPQLLASSSTNTNTNPNNPTDLRTPSPFAISAGSSLSPNNTHLQLQQTQHQLHQQQHQKQQQQQQQQQPHETRLHQHNTNTDTITSTTISTTNTSNDANSPAGQTQQKNWKQLQLEQRQFEQQQSLKQYQEREEQERRKQQERLRWQQEQQTKYLQQQEQEQQQHHLQPLYNVEEKLSPEVQLQHQNPNQPWLERRIPDHESVQTDPLYRDLMSELQKLEEGVAIHPEAEQIVEPETSQKPVFGQRIMPERAEVKEYEDVEFLCRLIPIYDSTMRVEWRLNGKPIEESSRITHEHEFGIVRLRIKRCEAEDSGIYQCKATNALGEAISTASLKVHAKGNVQCETLHPAGLDKIRALENPKPVEHVEMPLVEQAPKFITHIKDYVEKGEGESVHFECCLSPVDDPDLKTEWFFNGRPLVTGSRFHSIDDFGFIVLDIDWVFPRDTGEYVCRATNKAGSDITRSVLRVRPDKNIVLDSQLDNPTIIDKLHRLEFPDVQEEELNEEVDKPAHFVQQLMSKNQRHHFVEGDNVHFEARVGPAGDGQLTVEWFHNDKPLISGHRFKPSFDFGYIVLDILYVYAEDSGVYKCVARNATGTDVSQFEIQVTGKPSLVYQSQLPKEMVGGVQKITDMEAMWNKPAEPEEDEAPMPRMAPQFVLKPKPCVAFEGSCARFCCRIVGNPKPRLTWVLNGQTIVSGSRYKLTYDGMYHLTIPKCLLTDEGRLEVYARNLLGECFATTELKVRRKVDDYRGVLKNSPNPWYDEQSLKVYQRHRYSQDFTTDDDDDDVGSFSGSLYEFQQQQQQQQLQNQTRPLQAGTTTASSQQRMRRSPNSASTSEHLINYMDPNEPDVRELAQRYSPLLEPGDLHPVVAEKQVIMAPAPSTIQRALKVKDTIKSAEKSFHLPAGSKPTPSTSSHHHHHHQQDLTSPNQEQQQAAHVFGLDLPRYTATTSSQQQQQQQDPSGNNTADISRAKSPRRERRKQQEQQQEPYQEWLQRQQQQQQQLEEQQRNLNRISASEERMLFGSGSRQQSPASFYDSRLPPPSPESVVHGKEVHSHTHKQRQLERRANKEIIREIIEKETFEQEHKGVTKDNFVRGSSLDRQSTPDSVRSSQIMGMSRNNNQNQQIHHQLEMNNNSQQQQAQLDQSQELYMLADDMVNMTPPEFVQKLQPCQALDGDRAQFECSFIGEPRPSISWFRETKLIKPSNLYSITTTDSRSTLTIKRVSLHADAVYTVKAENAAGSAKSSANLVVDPHPSAGGDLSSTSVKSGGRIIETIRVGATSPAAAAQGSGKGGVSTYTTTTTTTRTDGGDDGWRSMDAGQSGEPSSQPQRVVKSVKTRRLGADEVSELIRASPEGGMVAPPTFLHTIHDLNCKMGELARLDARLIGSQPMEVRWLKDGQRVRADRVHKMVLEGDLYTLLILECSEKDEGNYQCVATNRIGEATCEAKLSLAVASSNIINSHPAAVGMPNATIASRQQIVSSNSSAQQATTTTSYHQPERLSPNPHMSQQQQRSGATPSPTSTSASQQNKPQFGWAKHHYSPLMNQYTSMTGPESGHQQEMPKLIKGLENQQVYEGKSVTLRCQISCFPIAEVHWFKQGDKPIKPSKYFRIFKDNDETYCLKILETFTEDQGEYKCVARSPNGQMNVETKATITVIPNSPNKI